MQRTAMKLLLETAGVGYEVHMPMTCFYELQSVITSGLPLHTLDLTTPLKDRFSEYLLSCLPGEGKEYCLQFTGPSGADAVEAALKLAKKYTGRPR